MGVLSFGRLLEVCHPLLGATRSVSYEGVLRVHEIGIRGQPPVKRET